MTILVFGNSGQVGGALSQLGGVRALDRRQADFEDNAQLEQAARSVPAEAFIVAAAYTAVDAAETDRERANQVNGAAVGVLAGVAKERDIPIVHYSTDYVFDGTGTDPWLPETETSPVNAYGRSKVLGEEAIRASGATHAIFRTSWVFSAHGANFVKTMLKLSETRDEISVVADQFGGPTSARALAHLGHAAARALVQDPGLTGTYHFSGAPEVTWAEFARAVFEKTGRDTRVNDISSDEFKTAAKRPQNSRMDCRSTEARFGLARPDWRIDLCEVLDDLGALKTHR